MSPRWKLKECPRCGGDIFMDIDENGWLGHCLQCGYMGTPASVPEPSVSKGNAAARFDDRLVRPLDFAKK